MTPARMLLSAMVAGALLIEVPPIAGDEQFPRGLLSGRAGPNRECTIETRPLSFGIYDPLADADLDAIGQIIYTCSNGDGGGPAAQEPGNKAIRIEMAEGTGNSYAPRHMAGLGQYLEYNIFLDATRRTVWGDGTFTTRDYYDAHPPNNTTVIVPAFGRIFAGQDVEAGAYGANVPVRILF